MTLVEIMVAVVILIVGALGTFVMLDGSQDSQRRTMARDQGTNLARDVIERSRQVDYAATSPPADIVRLLPDATLASGSTFTVVRRNVTYTVNATACSVDDPTDGAGRGNSSFCAAPCVPTATTSCPPPAPGPPSTRSASSINVLGVDVSSLVGVTAGGSVLDTVCRALGVESVGKQLIGLTRIIGRGTALGSCLGAPGGSDTAPIDVNPDDFRRFRVDVSWRVAGQDRDVSQTTLLTNPCQAEKLTCP